MRTPLCDLLGIEVPIILAPIIAPVGAPAGPRLAAVSEAGGLGTIALGSHRSICCGSEFAK